MVVAAMKHMDSNFVKLDKFKVVDFRRWQKKMHFLLSSMSVVYVLTTLIPKDGENATVDQIRRIAKWDNDDYVCKELSDSLEAKYMAKDASSKKFLVSHFTNYKMTNSRPVMEQYNELLDLLGRFTQHKINMDDAIQVEFKRISLTGFRSCTSHSRYQSVSKQTTRTACVLDDEQQVYMELCPNEILIDLDDSRLYKCTFVI
ncbi:hypothetical protein Tco_0001466 [Tanacetum coccineum]